MKVDYDFCMESKLTNKDLMTWLDLDDGLDNEFIYGWDFFGRDVMLINTNVIRISCIHRDFDRWANSEEYWFEIDKRSDKRDFIELIKEWRGLK